MKKLAFVAVGAAVATGALLVGRDSRAADHLDSPATQANHMADINDVYAWMTSDMSKINLVMTVSPADDGTRHFGPSVQYVFHVTEYAGATNDVAFPNALTNMGTEHKIICTFADDTHVQCWFTTGSHVDDYIKGDPSNNAGITSADNKIKLFAGERSDPFFFNLAGFKKAIAGVEAVLATGMVNPDASGCPQNGATDRPNAADVQGLRVTLSTVSATAVPPCAANQIDCFATFNTKAIVIQFDKSLVLGSANHLVSVWGSTHMGS